MVRVIFPFGLLGMTMCEYYKLELALAIELSLLVDLFLKHPNVPVRPCKFDCS